MRKKILSCVLSAALVVSFVPSVGFAELATDGASGDVATLAAAEAGSTFTVDGITYTVTSDTTVSVGAQTTSGTDFASTADVVVIPSQVNGYTVTGINAYAFSNGGATAATLSSITLPDTITSIGSYAFDACANLTSVTIPSSVTSMGMYCFANCTALESVTFADCDADGEKLVMDEGAFFVGSTKTGALKSIKLPKRLSYVPSKAFQHQNSMTSVSYAPGTTMSRIGSYAFYQCAALEYLEIPTLTAKATPIGGNWGINATTMSYSAGTGAFLSCNNLKEIVFLGNKTTDYGLGTTDFNIKETPNVVDYVTYYYPPVETVLYYGDHCDNIFSGSSFDTNHYQRISYFSSKEDAEAGADAVGEVFVRDDVALKDIASAVGQTDDKGALVYSGSVPAASSGMSWYYGGDSVDEGATHHICAYPIDGNDLSYGQLNMAQSSYTYNTNPVDISATVLDANGTTIDASQYTLSVKDASGAAVSLSQVKAVGTYTLTATAKTGGSYTGSVSTTFTVNTAACTVTRSSGNPKYATPNYETDSAFEKGAVDTVILVGRSALASGAAAAGLAGARNAVVVVTDDNALSLDAKRALNYYTPTSVFLVGVTDSTTVTTAITSLASIGSTVTVTNAFTADTQALTSYNLYYRTKSAGYWSSTTTAYVASCDDVPGAALAGSYGYRTVSPVFLTQEDGTLPAKTISAIASGGFTNVVFVGDVTAQSQTIAAALTTGGYTGATENISADNAYELSAAVAKDEVAAGVCGYNNVTLVSPEDEESAVIAAATCGQNQAPLLFADDEEGGDAAVAEIVEPNVYDVSQAYVFGVRGYISGEFQNQFERLWGAKDANDLKWATVSASFIASNTETTPVVTVTTSDGKTLVEDTDFTVNYTYNATDKRVLASKIETGDYTAIVTGKGNYAGTNYASFSAEVFYVAVSAPSADKGDKTTVTASVVGGTGSSYRFLYSSNGTTWTQAAKNTTGTVDITASATNAARQWKVVVTTADGQTLETPFNITINDPVVTTTTTPASTYAGKATINVSVTNFGTYSPAKYKYYYSTNEGKTWKQIAYHNKIYTSTDSLQVTANGTNAKRLWKVIVTFRDGRTAEAPFTVSYGA